MLMEYVGALQAGVQLVRDALAMVRELKAAKVGAPEELEQKLEQATQWLAYQLADRQRWRQRAEA